MLYKKGEIYENRGYMHGEPMYDYVVDKAYISY